MQCCSWCVCACVVVGCADMVTTSGVVSSRQHLTATLHCVDTGVIHHAVCVDHRWLANIAKTCTTAAATAARKWRPLNSTTARNRASAMCFFVAKLLSIA